jgi:carboxyl-terminal processing protease
VQILSVLRRFTFLLILVGFTGCSVFSSSTSPEAEQAARRISTDITKYRNGTKPTQDRKDASQLVKGANLFAQVYEQVRIHYVREVSDDKLIAAATKGIRDKHPEPDGAKDEDLIDAAINGMFSALDTYSTYLDEEHLQALRQQTRGSFGGLGIEVRKNGKYIQVVSPIDGTPAAKAGLAADDEIRKADGKSLADMMLRDAVLLLRGPPGSKVTLSIKRVDKPLFDVVVTRAIINIAAVRWKVNGNIGYVRVTSFSERAGTELADAIVAVKKKLGSRLRGFVLDLRNNPGGLLDQSIKVSDAFLHDGRIVSTRERYTEYHYRANRGDLTNGLPMVVLVNKGSASAAEIVAGALQDNGRAVIVGVRTFGKGTVQTIIPLSRRNAVKLTTAVYLRPSGRTVEGGIEPDQTIALDDKRDGDEQLSRALDLLTSFAVRPDKHVSVR